MNKKNLLREYLKLYKKNYLIDFRDKITLGKFYLILNQLANKNLTYLTTPARVQWEITNRCNLHCKQCYINSNEVINEKELTIKDCKNIINELKKLNILWIELQGGEPFVRKDIIDIIKIIKNNNIALKILTNGTLITDEIAKELSLVLSQKTDSIQISLDGSCAEVNDSIRGKNSFKRIIKGIKNCIRYGLNLSINTTLMDENINDFKNIYSLIKKMKGVKRYTFFTLMSVGRGKNLSFKKTKIALKNAIKIKQMESKYKRPKIYGFVGYLEHLPGYKEEILRAFKKLPFYNRNTATISSVDINYNGDVYPSAYLQFPELKAGNLKKGKLQKLWHTKKWNNIRKNVDRINGKCLICDKSEICSMGTITTSYIKYKCFNMNDTQCLFNPYIETKNLILRQPKESDLKFLKKMWENSEVMKYVGFPRGLKQSDEKIKKWINEWCTPDKLRLVIEDKRTKKPIGETGYRIEDNYPYGKNKKVTALDIKIGDRKYWGKGLATEALCALINQLRKTSDIDIFEVTPNIKNKTALKLYKKLGFKEVGKIHKFTSSQGVIINYQYMELRK